MNTLNNIIPSNNCTSCGAALGCGCQGKKQAMYYNGTSYCIDCYNKITVRQIKSNQQNNVQVNDPKNYSVNITSAKVTITNNG
jgi:hypothetical protein